MKEKLIVATRNKKKLVEIKQILRHSGIDIRSLEDYPAAPRIVENGKTFKENAAKKALKIARSSGYLSLGEDSGLCVNALGGRPGIYSSRFSGKGKSDLKNNLKLLRMLKGVPKAERRAHYTCAVALADKKGLIGVVEGRCYGFIGFEMKGSRGFGYDPLFIDPKRKKTFAQLPAAQKHRISHRYIALKKAARLLLKHIR